jgi:hypothetical protein
MNNQIEFDIFIIKTLPDEYFNRCKDSLIETSGGMIANDQITMIREKSSRERTLNAILKQRENSKDLFIVADDIIFLSGWYESLINNYNEGNIIGFSMIDAQSGLLQDFGYDFVSIDGELSYRGLYKHKELKELYLSEFRECNAVTGCAMFIKNIVLNDVIQFPLEGVNRWGELLFSYLASNYGHDTIVLNAHLRHFAISTKQNKDVKKSSMSWLVERKLWKNVVKEYLLHVKPKITIQTKVSKKIISLIGEANQCLIYGAGTVADIILSSINKFENIDLCSGLPEEVGLQLNGLIIKNIKEIKASSYEIIIISAIGYEEKIISRYFKNRKNIFTLINENNFIQIS